MLLVNFAQSHCLKKTLFKLKRKFLKEEGSDRVGDRTVSMVLNI